MMTMMKMGMNMMEKKYRKRRRMMTMDRNE
jgi:hypothetical protein